MIRDSASASTLDMPTRSSARRRPADWLAPMLPDLRHVHLHDNHGALDEHLPLGAGTIDFAPILAALAAHPDITITLENQDILPSLQYLQANGWL